MFASAFSTAALHSCQFLENSVRGVAGSGGAIVSKGTLSLVNSTLGYNRVTATKNTARGGALHVLQGAAVCGLAGDPAGSALVVCDAASGAALVLAWPLPGMPGGAPLAPAV